MKNFAIFSIVFFALFSAASLSAQEANFQDFLKQFPKASLPYTFNVEELQGSLEKRQATKTARLDWEYYSFLPELERSAQFSNMPVHPEPVAAFETEQYHAVLYNIARGYSRGAKTYSITIFDKAGNYIGTHFVAGVNAQSITSATIDESLLASVKVFQVNWASDYRLNGMVGNIITGLTLTNVHVFELTTYGNPDEIEWTANAFPQEKTEIAKMK